MTIYEIDRQIQDLIDSAVDEETGEVRETALEEIEALQMERDAKAEGLALACKDLTAEAAAIKAEEDALRKRRQVIENKAKRAKNYLEYVLAGEKFKTPRVAVSYRTSTKTDVSPEFIPWAAKNAPDLLRYSDPAPDATAIKEALKAGQILPGATLIETKNLIIK